MTQIGVHRIDGGWADLYPASQARPAGQTSSVRGKQDCPSHTMDAFEQLAAEVAHDFNDLLTVLAGYSNLLLGLNVCAVTLTRQLVYVSRHESARRRSSRRTSSPRG